MPTEPKPCVPLASQQLSEPTCAQCGEVRQHVNHWIYTLHRHSFVDQPAAAPLHDTLEADRMTHKSSQVSDAGKLDRNQTSLPKAKEVDTDASESPAPSSPELPQPRPSEPPPLTVIYTNHKGVTAERHILPQTVYFGSTQWHSEPQWILEVWDVDKQARRGFAFKNIAAAPLSLPLAQPRPKIVCLCGSTRFYKQFQIANFQETMKGNIILSVGFYAHAQGHEWHVAEHGQHVGINDEEKEKLDELHKRKIDLCDEVFVLNVGGYIGSSTRSEIDYAIQHRKPIRYLEPPRLTQTVPPPLAPIRDGDPDSSVSALPENLKEKEPLHLCPTCGWQVCECPQAVRATAPLLQPHDEELYDDRHSAMQDDPEENPQAFTPPEPPRITAIRKDIDDAERGDGHDHAEFTSCDECVAAEAANGRLIAYGWQNAITLIEEIDRLQKRNAQLIQMYADLSNGIRPDDKSPALSPSLPRWIPLSEKLPELGTRILAGDSKGRNDQDCFDVVNSEDYFGRDYEIDGKTLCDCFTHWQPLPQPPRMESSK